MASPKKDMGFKWVSTLPETNKALENKTGFKKDSGTQWFCLCLETVLWGKTSQCIGHRWIVVPTTWLNAVWTYPIPCASFEITQISALPWAFQTSQHTDWKKTPKQMGKKLCFGMDLIAMSNLPKKLISVHHRRRTISMGSLHMHKNQKHHASEQLHLNTSLLWVGFRGEEVMWIFCPFSSGATWKHTRRSFRSTLHHPSHRGTHVDGAHVHVAIFWLCSRQVHLDTRRTETPFCSTHLSWLFSLKTCSSSKVVCPRRCRRKYASHCLYCSNLYPCSSPTIKAITFSKACRVSLPDRWITRKHLLSVRAKVLGSLNQVVFLYSSSRTAPEMTS